MDKKTRVLIILGIILIVIIFSLILFFHDRNGKTNGKTNGKKSYLWRSAPAPDSVCSVPCGGGKRFMNVWCEAVDSTGKDIQQVDDKYCTGTKPPSEEDCNTQACEWAIGDWSACSQPCGIDGVQTRTISCPNPGNCGPAPPTTQPCANAQLCPWTYGSWSVCDVPCGTGTQTRTGSCVRNNQPVDPKNCGTEGPLSQSCSTGNECKWENSSKWLPYPPSFLNLVTFNGKNTKMVLQQNQYVGLGAGASNQMIAQMSVVPVASSTPLLATYNSTYNYLTFTTVINGDTYMLAVNASLESGQELAFQVLLWNISKWSGQDRFSPLAITVSNGELVAGMITHGTQTITNIGTDLLYSPLENSLYFGKAYGSYGENTSIANIFPLV